MHRPGLISAMLLSLVFAFTTGCDTLNVGTPYGGGHPTIGRVFITPATSWNAGETATVTVEWTGTAPFTIAIDVGTDESVPAGTDAGTSPFTWDFILEEGEWFGVTVTLTDVNGNDTETTTYGPVGPPLNDPPVIESAVYAGGVLTVEVSDPDGDELTVAVTDVVGLAVDHSVQLVTGGEGVAVFNWLSANPLTGATGTTTVFVNDSRNDANPVTQEVVITIEGPLDWPEEGELWAVPMMHTAGIGDTVTVQVLSGDFPTDAAFNYLNGVGVTVTDGGDYVAGTFNVGSIGGEIKDVDGIWADMDPAPSTFFVPEDFMMAATDVTADSSLDFMGFNITPIGSGEVTGGGELFNFGISFDAAGEYELGFLEFQDVKRTYYSDAAATEYNWPDLSNTSDFNTTVTVN